MSSPNKDSKLSSRYKAVIAILCGMFTVNATMSAINISLVIIAESLKIPITQVNFAYAGFVMFFAGFVLIAGRISDKIGYKKIYYSGIILYCLGTIIGLISNNLSIIELACCTQGLACALIYPSGTSLLFKIFEKHKATPMALVGTAGGVANAVIPLTVGYFSTNLGWKSLYLANLLPILISIIYCRHVIESRKLTSSSKTLTRSNFIGVTSTAITLLSTYYLFDSYNHNNLIQTYNLLIFLICIISTYILVNHCRHAKSPFIDVTILRNRTFISAALIRFFNMACFVAILFYSTTLFQVTYQLTEFHTGMALLPMMCTLTIFSTVSGKISNTKRPEIVLRAGILILLVSTIILSFFDSNISFYYLSEILIIFALGLALATPPLGMIALGNLNETQRGIGSGILFTFTMFGALFGLTLSNVIANFNSGHYTAFFERSFSETSILASLILLGCLFISGQLYKRTCIR